MQKSGQQSHMNMHDRNQINFIQNNKKDEIHQLIFIEYQKALPNPRNKRNYSDMNAIK